MCVVTLRIMDTPFGKIPDRYRGSMRPQDMHDYLRKRYGRRALLKGAAAAGALAAAGPIFWRQSDAFAADWTPSDPATTTTPQWIAYGPTPGTSMWVSWSSGSYDKATAPKSPILQYADSLSTLQAGDGQSVSGSSDVSVSQVPTPSVTSGETTDDTYYVSTLISGLTPETTYWYRVSNNGGSTWNSYAYFTTGKTGIQNFSFCATGDENETTDTAAVVSSVLSFNPDFTIVAGDLSYSSGGVETLGKPYGEANPTTLSSYSPSDWDAFFSYIGETAQYVPWIVGVGNHEMEPLNVAGYAGVLTRFPDLAQSANGGKNDSLVGSNLTYAGSTATFTGPAPSGGSAPTYTVTNGQTYNTGSPVVRAFTYGNVGFIQLDGNDLSAEISYNNGYTGGQQTSWLVAQLATYRASGSGVDFVVVYFHNCPYCSNTTHGSDAGIRNVWQPIFDTFNVDVVINGHVHAYERNYPLYNNAVVKAVATGDGYTNFYTQQGALTAPPGSISATSYICAGGGGNSLYTAWYGTSGQDGPASGGPTSDSNVSANTYDTSASPFVDQWEVGSTFESGTAKGAPSGAKDLYAGSGTTENDPNYNSAAPFSAFRFGTWSHLVINVTAPTTAGGITSMEIQSIDANVSSENVTLTNGTAATQGTLLDSVTIQRYSTVPASDL
jgi:hypothetical protein